MFAESLTESMAVGPGAATWLGCPRGIPVTGGTGNCHTKPKMLPSPCLKPAPGKPHAPGQNPGARRRLTLHLPAQFHLLSWETEAPGEGSPQSGPWFPPEGPSEPSRSRAPWDLGLAPFPTPHPGLTDVPFSLVEGDVTDFIDLLHH